MGVRVAVIGAGALGLSATKNLTEDGFDVTTYETRDYVGGLWKDAHDSSVSAHSTTIFNSSKYRSAMSDFLMAESDDDYPTTAQLHDWFQRYVRHFDLLDRFRLGTKVASMKRECDQWALEVQKVSTGETTKDYFDKVCIATGSFFTPRWPKLEGLNQFRGKVIHSIDYHASEDFKDHNVLILGMHATAQDVTDSLFENAKHVYLAHRSGIVLLPRYNEDGSTFDQTGTLTVTFFMAFMLHRFPRLWSWMFDKLLGSVSEKAFPDVPKEWGLRPAPPSAISTPLMADTLWSYLQSGFAEPVSSIRRIIGPHSVELESGRILEDIDSIIYCTGYTFNIPDGLIPKTSETEALHPYPGNTVDEPPNLYRNIFPLHPDPKIRNSLAFLGQSATHFPGFIKWELHAMAISQVWRGTTMLPPYEEMLKWRKRNKAELQGMLDHYKALENSTYYPVYLNMGEDLKWADKAAGCGIYENLGTAWFNWRAWKFWLEDKELYNLCMKGVFTPVLWRLFETGKGRLCQERRLGQ